MNGTDLYCVISKVLNVQRFSTLLYYKAGVNADIIRNTIHFHIAETLSPTPSV